MNCLEFRRICLSEPATRAADYIEHRETCGECGRFAAGVGALDKKIYNAMQVPVPEDLAARIRLRQAIGEEDKIRRSRPWQYALAASFFLTVAIGGLLGYRVYTADRYIERLQAVVLDHIKQEPQFLAASNHSSAAQFKQVMAAFGGRVMADVGSIQSAEICPLKDGSMRIAHTVLKGKMGPVTVIYVKGDSVKQKTMIDDARFKGVLVAAGAGNLAVVGELSEPLEPMVEMLQKSIVWKI